MGRHAEWEMINAKPGIILIQDLGNPGCLSITNDAEWVYLRVSFHYGRHRVIYRDTYNEWAEIVGIYDAHGIFCGITFKPWHGEVWDALSREY